MPIVTTQNRVRISVNPQVRRAISLILAVINDRGRTLDPQSVIEEKASVFDNFIAGDGEE